MLASPAEARGKQHEQYLLMLPVNLIRTASNLQSGIGVRLPTTMVTTFSVHFLKIANEST